MQDAWLVSVPISIHPNGWHTRTDIRASGVRYHDMCRSDLQNVGVSSICEVPPFMTDRISDEDNQSATMRTLPGTYHQGVSSRRIILASCSLMPLGNSTKVWSSQGGFRTYARTISRWFALCHRHLRNNFVLIQVQISQQMT